MAGSDRERRSRRRPAVGAVLAAAGLTLLVAACSSLPIGALHRVGSAPYEQGSGRAATETRPLTAFHAVSAAQGVTVVVAKGTPGASVTADDNLVARITTEVVDGTLHVDVSGSIETRQPLKVDVTVSDPIDRLAATSGASIELEGLAVEALAVEANSGATVRAGGRVSNVTVSSAAGSTADLRNLTSRTAAVDVTAGSTAHVDATEAVTGSCTAGSTLRVTGGGTTTGVAVDTSSSLGED